MKTASIHETACCHKNSHLGNNIQVGPYAIVEDGVTLGDNTVIMAHAYIGKGTTMGKNNVIHMGAIIGHSAQNKASENCQGELTIGDDNVFREYVTVHRSTAENTATRIGSHNYFMVNSHVGHDCVIEDYVTVTNAVLLAGHVHLENHCVVGGGAGVHQFCRIGRYAMVGGNASITQDVPPYMMVDDNEELIGSINMTGLRRAGLTEEAKRAIKNAYRTLYLSGLNTVQALEAITKQCHSPEVDVLIEFIKNSKRGILRHR